MIESLLGGLFGGLFRLAPEVLKLIDAKDARKHELAMMDVEVKLTELRAQQAMHQVDAEVDKAHLTALTEALGGQEKMAVAGGTFAAAVSALVRPLVTYWLVIFWSAVKIASMSVAYHQGADWKAVLVQAWGADDMALFMGVISFWFVGRSFKGVDGGKG